MLYFVSKNTSFSWTNSFSSPLNSDFWSPRYNFLTYSKLETFVCNSPDSKNKSNYKQWYHGMHMRYICISFLCDIYWCIKAKAIVWTFALIYPVHKSWQGKYPKIFLNQKRWYFLCNNLCCQKKDCKNIFRYLFAFVTAWCKNIFGRVWRTGCPDEG